MPPKSPTYKLEYFKKGSLYSARSDYRRFVTMDYNMESYIGIVGVGIINGWKLEQIDGLKIRITPGTGLIDGLFSESPYIVKQRSEMVSGDREISVYNVSDRDEPEEYLTPSERIVYIGIVREYDPGFQPPPPTIPIVNAYVKVVRQQLTSDSILVLADNTDNYIYAKRLANRPYPLLSDYPYLTMDKPSRADYANYESYQADKNIYDSQIKTIHEYLWYDSVPPGGPYVNHFTEVKFQAKPIFDVSSQELLLGKIVTRRGAIVKIDVDRVDSLENMSAQIEAYAKEYLEIHRHGGPQDFDPPKINLDTDIRETVLTNHDLAANKYTFRVLESIYTSVESGHKHLYYVDANGDGLTIGMVGDGDIHFHYITAYVVGNPEINAYGVSSHSHTITQPAEENEEATVNPVAEVEGNIWDETSRFIVYVDNEYFGNEDSSYIDADPDKELITLTGGVGASYNTYFASFEVAGAPFSFRQRGISVTNFVYDMIDYLNVQFKDVFASDPEANPFTTITDDVEVRNDYEIRWQCASAQLMLKETGDQFILTPPAADNITIVLEKRASSAISKDYDVYIEILGNVEITGKIEMENILFVNAQKIATGVMDVRIIPMISHAGRLKEPFRPFTYPLLTRDGIQYKVMPWITTTELGHYHTAYVDDNETGNTYDTMLGGEAVYYAEDEDNNQYFIAHVHAIDESKTQEMTSEVPGLSQWQASINNANAVSSTHMHDLIYPAIGNNKTIYALREDAYGNLYLGTSDGFIVVTVDPAYSVTINDSVYYGHSSDTWTVIKQAVAQYEKEKEVSFDLDETVYQPQLDRNESYLGEIGGSILLSGNIVVGQDRDIIMIKRLAYIKVPNFYVRVLKLQDELKNNDVVVEVVKVLRDTGVVVSEDEMIYAYYLDKPVESETGILRRELVKRRECNSGESPSRYFLIDSQTGDRIPICVEELEDAFYVEYSFNDMPIWSIDLKPVRDGDCGYRTETPGPYEYWARHTDIVVGGAKRIGYNIDLDVNFYNPWGLVPLPNYAGTMRKVLRDINGDYWFATTNGVMVSRRYQGQYTVNVAGVPMVDTDIRDLAEGYSGVMYSATADGIFKTVDGGITWIRLNVEDQGGFRQLVRDYSADISNTVGGHYHEVIVNSVGDGFLSESIGVGTPHVHSVNEWEVATSMGHTHSIVVTLYAVGATGVIYKSNDDGETWNEYAVLTNSDHSSIFACFDEILVGLSDGLYVWRNNTWELVLKSQVFSFEWDYDQRYVLIGGNNVIYRTSDNTEFDTVISFDGNPSVLLVVANVPRYYGYAYSNYARSFFFPEFLFTRDEVNAFVDFGQWYATNGSWNENKPYEIYIDNERVISTKYGIDRRAELGIKMDVDSTAGLLDFGVVTTLSKDVDTYDDTIGVMSSSGFFSGDSILIIPQKDHDISGRVIKQIHTPAELYEIFGLDVLTTTTTTLDSAEEFTTSTTTIDIVLQERFGIVESTGDGEEGSGWFTAIPIKIESDGTITIADSSPLSIEAPGLVRMYFKVGDTTEWVESSLTQNIVVGDTTIHVLPEASLFLELGKQFFIYQDENRFVTGDISEINSGGQSPLFSEYDFSRAYEAVVYSVGNNELSLDSKVNQHIFADSLVLKVLPLNSTTSIVSNIYDPQMINVGNNTHEDIEDALSYYADGRPFWFDGIYMSNLLQLSQAMRYVYPEINEYFTNDLFYDFHYAWTDTDPVYPGIDRYIDRITTDIYNQSTYDMDFQTKKAFIANKIVYGTGKFLGYIIVATDVGVFWTRYGGDAEGNWFYVSELQLPVYDILITNDDKVFLATPNGTYSSEDMESWTLQSSPSIYYPSYVMSLRWLEGQVVTVAPHTVSFYNEGARGVVQAISGSPYANLLINRAVDIRGAGVKDGTYLIYAVSPQGNRFWITRRFPGIDEVVSNVTVIMAEWWKQWNSDTNTMNVNLTNTLLVGGQSRISFNNLKQVGVWNESAIASDIGEFSARAIYPISSGSVLCATASEDISADGNKLLRSKELGYEFETLESFDPVVGGIDDIEVTDDNNIEIEVSYVTRTRNYKNGDLAKLSIDIYEYNPPAITITNSNVSPDIDYTQGTLSLVYAGKVIWNYIDGENDYIVIYGADFSSMVRADVQYVFKTIPFQINTIVESPDNRVLFGTNHGVYTDDNTLVNKLLPNGKLIDIGISMTCNYVDLHGSIVSVNKNPVNSHVVLSVKLDYNSPNDSMRGKSLFIVDADPVLEFEVVTNRMADVSGESTIEIKAIFSDEWMRVNTKRFVVVGDHSLIYVSYKYPVLNNQLAGGELYVIDDQNANYGDTYKIVSNTSTYIEIDKSLRPASLNVARGLDTSTDIILSGQHLRAIQSENRLTLWSDLGVRVRENALAGLNVNMGVKYDVLSDGSSSAGTSTEPEKYVFNGMPIISNTNMSMVVDITDFPKAPLLLGVQDGFTIDGQLFNSLSTFDNQRSSVESGHYHMCEVVGDIVYGTVNGFDVVNSSYVTFEVSESVNFDLEIVQRYGSLFEGAQILFKTTLNPAIRYVTHVVSHTPTTITVQMGNADMWSFSQATLTKISVGWLFEIDARNYGYTYNTIYDDFILRSFIVTEDINRGDMSITMETTGITVGDRIRIQDETGSFVNNIVSSIIDATHIGLSLPMPKTFYVRRNTQARILTDTFSNTHEHTIRRSEISVVRVSEYVDHTYPSEHAHLSLPLIPSANVLLRDSEGIIVAGTDSIVYKSKDSGNTWNAIVNLDDYVETRTKVDGVSAGTVIANDNILLGTNNGLIFVKDVRSGSLVLLTPPSV